MRFFHNFFLPGGLKKIRFYHTGSHGRPIFKFFALKFKINFFIGGTFLRKKNSEKLKQFLVFTKKISFLPITCSKIDILKKEKICFVKKCNLH